MPIINSLSIASGSKPSKAPTWFSPLHTSVCLGTRHVHITTRAQTVSIIWGQASTKEGDNGQA